MELIVTLNKATHHVELNDRLVISAPDRRRAMVAVRQLQAACDERGATYRLDKPSRADVDDHLSRNWVPLWTNTVDTLARRALGTLPADQHLVLFIEDWLIDRVVLWPLFEDMMLKAGEANASIVILTARQPEVYASLADRALHFSTATKAWRLEATDPTDPAFV